MFPNLSALFLVLLFVAPSIVRPFYLSPSNAPMSLPALLPSPAHPDGPCPHENDAHIRARPHVVWQYSDANAPMSEFAILVAGAHDPSYACHHQCPRLGAGHEQC